MKLFTKYNSINLLATIFIFLLSGIAFYFLVHYLVLHQVDEDLKIEQGEINTFVKEHNHLPEVVHVRDQITVYNPASVPMSGRKYQTLFLYDSMENEWSNFRRIEFGIKADNKYYNVTVAKSMEGADNLIELIVIITAGVIILLMLILFITNRVLLRRLWEPFYNTLESIKTFNLSNKKEIAVESSDIDEFNELGKVANSMQSRIIKDYETLKEFADNASHEMQTPLAVIRSKLDLLIQDEKITEEQSQTLQSTYHAVQKLARLNQSLLLLAKIENRQFDAKEMVDLEQMLLEKTEEFNELWQAEGIHASLRLSKVKVPMNAELADILLNNLLSNATRYNTQNGSITVQLTPDHLLVANTSREKELENDRLFTRFYKPSQNNGHNGLGLSIIKQICDVSGFNVKYVYEDDQHSFIIKLSN